MKKPNRNRPVLCVWNGEHFIPLPRFKRLCDQQFEVHEEYPLVVQEERSQASHNHYFAALTEAWKNLDERYRNHFPSMEHLRAWALVETGYATEANYVMESPERASALGIQMRALNPLAVIQLKGNIVKYFEAESQSRKAMKKEKFEQSKKDVLELVAGMARTTPAELKKNAGRAA